VRLISDQKHKQITNHHMKKTITGALMLLAGASAVYAQGTVSMANYLALNTYLYVSYKAANGVTTDIGGTATGVPPTSGNFALEVANGNDWSVQLYAAPGLNDAPSTLSPVSGAIVTMGTTPATAGIWSSSYIATLPGTTGGATGTATLQLYAWYNEGGAITSYASALADGVPTGVSSPANISGLGGGSPPATAPTLPEGLGNIVVAVPEPSTIALGVMGASAFLMRLRRK
jgi:hypothetical protein